MTILKLISDNLLLLVSVLAILQHIFPDAKDEDGAEEGKEDEDQTAKV